MTKICPLTGLHCSIERCELWLTLTVPSIIKPIFSFSGLCLVEITQHPETSLVTRNEPVTLHCEAKGDPIPEIVWWKNGERVITADMDHKVSILSIDIHKLINYPIFPFSVPPSPSARWIVIFPQSCPNEERVRCGCIQMPSQEFDGRRGIQSASKLDHRRYKPISSSVKSLVN